MSMIIFTYFIWKENPRDINGSGGSDEYQLIYEKLFDQYCISERIMIIGIIEKYM